MTRRSDRVARNVDHVGVVDGIMVKPGLAAAIDGRPWNLASFR